MGVSYIACPSLIVIIFTLIEPVPDEVTDVAFKADANVFSNIGILARERLDFITIIVLACYSVFFCHFFQFNTPVLCI